jgi:uncharacterized membrane protein
MITLAYWQFALLLTAIPVAFFFGMSVLAWVAMAGYSDDVIEIEEELQR